MRLHVRMVNEFKGAKGVKPERIAEAFTVRHCALSLVGEPIMYPRINELLGELHQRRISTFLVTNAQFPEQIERLVPVTQLYVSIDAATKESLRAVDRPLQGLLGALPRLPHQLRDKRQRTVYRLTLVKAWNMEEVEAYVKLLDLARPDRDQGCDLLRHVRRLHAHHGARALAPRGRGLRKSHPAPSGARPLRRGVRAQAR